jgi:hypothetical protein
MLASGVEDPAVKNFVAIGEVTAADLGDHMRRQNIFATGSNDWHVVAAWGD